MSIATRLQDRVKNTCAFNLTATERVKLTRTQKTERGTYYTFCDRSAVFIPLGTTTVILHKFGHGL